MQINVFAFEKDLRMQTWPQQKEKRKTQLPRLIASCLHLSLYQIFSVVVVVENAMFAVKFILQKALQSQLN